jgi:hypothetical protein
MNDRTLGERINTWVQIFALVLGGIWAAYTFVYKEMIQPSLLPSHISIKSELSKVGKKDSMIAIKAKFTITNNSKKRAILLPSSFAVLGVTNIGKKTKENKSDINLMFEKADNLIISSEDSIIAHNGFITQKKFIMTGPLFEQWLFDPNETASNSLIFYIPNNTFDNIEMMGLFAIVNNSEGISDYAEWSIFKDGSSSVTLFREGKNKKDRGNFIDKYNKNDRAFLEKRDFGIITANTVLSLWQ